MNNDRQEAQKKHWTTRDLAEAAGVSTARIRQLLLAGRIEGDKAGPIWIIPQSEVERFLSERGVEV